MSEKLPQFIQVKGRRYRLAAKKQISTEDVKESISRAADKAAIENIVSNLVVHAADIQQAAPAILEMLEGPKSKADKAVDNLKAHCEVLQEFLDQLMPTYGRYAKKHPAKKAPKADKPEEKDDE